MRMEAVDQTLARLFPQLADENGSTWSVVRPPVLMPMHVAVDATPVALNSERGGATFLKLYAPDMLRFIDLEAAVEASLSAAALGVAPAVKKYWLDAGAILFEMLPADTWRMASREDLRSRAVLDAVVQAKRAWHGGPKLRWTRSPFDVIRSFLVALDALGSGAGASPSFAMLRAWIVRAEQAIAAAGHDSGPLHGENMISNVMLGSDGRVMLVDFDQAANGDPFYDLGGVCLECCSFLDEIETVIVLYRGASDRRLLHRVLVYMLVDDFLWACWALIAQATSPRNDKIEFYKYAQNRFVRCQYWLSHPDFEQVLRHL